MASHTLWSVLSDYSNFRKDESVGEAIFFGGKMQKREPPAYQEYASSILSKAEFREMTMQERGLFYTLKMECWVNRSVPKDHKKLAQFIGISILELEELLPNIMPFFATFEGRIHSPELDNYRLHLERISNARAKGANKTNSMKSTKTCDARATIERAHKSRSSVNCASGESDARLVQFSSVQFSSVKPSLPATDIIPSTLRGGYPYNPDEGDET